MGRQHLSECICDHMSPGCPHKEVSDTQKAAREKALAHTSTNTTVESLDDSQAPRVDMAISSLG